MKHKCSKCGHVGTIKDKGRSKGGSNRWRGMTKKQRSEEMKRVRAKGISSANVEVRHTGPGTGVETKETDQRPGVDLH